MLPGTSTWSVPELDMSPRPTTGSGDAVNITADAGANLGDARRTYGAQYARKVGAMVHLPVNVVLVQAIGNAHIPVPLVYHRLSSRDARGSSRRDRQAQPRVDLQPCEFLARTSEGSAPGTLRTYGMRHACIATNKENADLKRRADIVADAISGAASDP
ncbi:hypothetical protein K466DRAFT_651753 [Polyporus arcularius HHB13444]|uniref:Uncharacterized protein n=1 Tax=Polyporus arcularius HHB13444 TaxID=1314778 RepID=A0A5C3PMA0_9APHY|nr:hypothetical protein K466DRAFT_651753 [Polyporus arcularius HHB13444]